MSDSSPPDRTTGDDHEATNALAAEAEAGYDLGTVRRRPGRPLLGGSPAVVVPVRLPSELHLAARSRADEQRTSVSDIVRRAVRGWLVAEPEPLPVPLDENQLAALVFEAEAGYNPGTGQTVPVRPRPEVVPIRFPPELKSAVERRADRDATSVSDIVRTALRSYLSTPEPDPPRSPERNPRSPRGPTEADTCREYVVPGLKDAGWSDEQIVEQYRITDGRIVNVGGKHRRGSQLRADYVLEYRPGLPIAVVEAKREYSMPGQGMQQAKNYAQLLDVPFAYSTNGTGIVEDDRNTGHERFNLAGFPGPDDLWSRYREWNGLGDQLSTEGLLRPFNRALRNSDGSTKEPRYYQRVAVNRTVSAILGGRRRLLLTMATGTGKTFVSMQIVWKLWEGNWRPGRRPRVLYLADRDVLIDQPKDREFGDAFGSGAGSPLIKLQGEAKAGREIYFGLYQQLADRGSEPNGLFREFDPDFFDLIIVDECHRGSARAESSWRKVLDHFSSATQLGLTATPRRDETADTYNYFGGSLYEYSLAQGIADGFLAPYRVRRVILSPDAFGWAPDPGQVDLFRHEIPEGLYTTSDFERVVSLLSRTEAAAKHLTDFLKRTNRLAKTIVFCVNQEHADQMRRALHNANADLTSQHPDYAVRIVSDEQAVGRQHLSRFQDTESNYPVVATTSELLSTGVDLPTVRNVVLFRPVGSMALFKQMIGRGTRLFPDDDKLSFDIIDYAGATTLFSDPAFDGPPERVDREEIDEEGNVVDDRVVEEPEPPFDVSMPDRPEDLDPTEVDEREVTSKFYIDDTQVWVTAEASYHLDSDTRRLRLVEYRDFVAETVRSLYPDAVALRSQWTNRVGRLDVLEALVQHGVDPAEVIRQTGTDDVDLLDALVFMAWNAPLTTRGERARRVRAEHSDYFNRFQPAARQVLDDLLDTYATRGIDQIDDLGVLQVPPLSTLGTPAELANRFGSAEALRSAIERLGDLVYVA